MLVIMTMIKATRTSRRREKEGGDGGQGGQGGLPRGDYVLLRTTLSAPLSTGPNRRGSVGSGRHFDAIFALCVLNLISEILLTIIVLKFDNRCHFSLVSNNPSVTDAVATIIETAALQQKVDRGHACQSYLWGLNGCILVLCLGVQCFRSLGFS